MLENVCRLIVCLPFDSHWQNKQTNSNKKSLINRYTKYISRWHSIHIFFTHNDKQTNEGRRGQRWTSKLTNKWWKLVKLFHVCKKKSDVKLHREFYSFLFSQRITHLSFIKSYFHKILHKFYVLKVCIFRCEAKQYQSFGDTGSESRRIQSTFFIGDLDSIY